MSDLKRNTGGTGDAGSSREVPVLNSPRGGAWARGSGPGAKPKHFTGTIRRFMNFVGNERKGLLLIFLFLLTSSLLTLAGPYLIGEAVNAMTADNGKVNLRLLEMIILVLAAAYLADAVLNLLQSWLMAGVSQRIIGSLRRTLFGKLQKLPLGFFDGRRHGELMSRLSNDIDNVSQSLSLATVQLMAGVISITGSLIMMLVLSPLLTLATLITVPLVYVLARSITRKTRVLFKEQQAQLGKLNGHIEETITGMEVVKAFNRERKSMEEFNAVNDRMQEVGLKAQIYSGFLMPLLGVINNIGFAAVAIAGGILAVQGNITVGVIASFLSYSRQFVRPLNELANMYNVLQSGVAGAERVFEILDEPEESADTPGATPVSNPRGRVTFENVSFSYRSDVPILQGVSFDAPAGSSTALIGPTGSGKTTIVNLITRFYDVTEGRILLDGRDIREYTRESLRRCFGIVLQDTYLFSGTIRENILYGNPDASETSMREASTLANADRFIRRLPQGYDTMLSENGGNLSQGQRQLLAIARVILAEPAILILDEATSSIDTRTELHIQEALLRVMEGRTSFIIAHRLNTIRDADTIMYIDRGRIVEQGSHEDLLQKRGAYAELL
ncbi:multidrug ABC transporter ATP-binding protein [Paenibacillus swuensis]|uniref:Multidrug ABC transporter ATP-binding protein n=1 Tax=Paenibacillus swuensis TaxID=1178515 RepID=A0A172TFT3_9BACL|nr:ABC transporter ATP-binding protein [Paenibacillus swuensis]ANE45764.1 multidrug ABC transporter ATP-binding protein [Paenibacillus swuensis]